MVAGWLDLVLTLEDLLGDRMILRGSKVRELQDES